MAKTKNSKYNNKKNGRGGYPNSRPNTKNGNNKYSDSKGCNNYSKDEELKSNTNDPAWYSEDAALLRDAASIPFVWRTGSKFDDKVAQRLISTSTNVVGDWSGRIPGICAIEIWPTIGISTTPEAPVNIAATSMYSFIRHANSGHKNYDSTDLMMYCLAMSSIYSMLNWLQRIYGIAMLYSQHNMYLPDQLLRANGVDPASVHGGMADFRFRLNVLINKAASLAVPATLPLFKRQAFLFQNVYSEGASIKDQLYMYIPAAFWKRTIDTSTGSAKLVYVQPTFTSDEQPGTPSLDSISQLLDMADDMIGAVYSDEDCGVMSGDILKAYGLENIIKLQPVDPEYTISPIVDLAVLEQMKNATCYGKVTCEITEKIPATTQSPFLESVPVGSDAVLGSAPASTFALINAYKGNRILVTSSLNPTPAIIIENTRLMTYTNDVKQITCGSEVAGKCWIWTGLSKSDFKLIRFVKLINATKGAANHTDMLSDFTTAAAFKFKPQQIVFEYSKDSSKNYMDHRGYNVDFDNFVVLSHDELEHLHTTAMLSELHVPLIGKAQ